MAMFKQHEDPPVNGPAFGVPPPGPAPASTGDLLLGAGAEFEGKLTFKGTVRIDSKFKGSIVTNDVLVVGEHARIDADITCGTVIVHGQVNGNITAKDAVELHQPAKVRGDVETASLSMDRGVVLHGQVKMTGMPAP
jgi:cytoskeletal protein CcmA (bactofilin family)